MTTTDIAKLKDILYQYAEDGWHLFALLPGLKIPYKGSSGFKDATQTHAGIDDLIKKHPGCNIGGFFPRMFAIDIDPRHGGFESLKRLQAEHQQLTRTRTHKTGGGGNHFIYRQANGYDIAKTENLAGYRGIDLQSKGCYIVLPPSITESPYEVTDTTPIEDAPVWLCELALKSKTSTFTGQIELNPGKKIPQGQNDAWLVSQAGAYRRRGDNEDAIFEKLKIDVLKLDQDPARPYTEKDLRRIAKSISKHEPGNMALGVSGLPQISTSNRQLRDKSSETMQALIKSNTPPVVFNVGGELARLGSSSRDELVIQRFNEPMLMGHLTKIADFIKTVKKSKEEFETLAVSPPKDITEDLLTRPEYPAIPRLKGITRTPIIRIDGTIYDKIGYDPQTEFYYLPVCGFSMPEVPESPTDGQAFHAIGVISDLLWNFPFVDTSSRDNYLAMLFTLVFRHLIKGLSPIGVIDKNSRGIGAGLLTDVACIIATGNKATCLGFGKDEEELEKQINTSLMSGNQNIIFDNIEREFSSPTLARLSTLASIPIREMRQNKKQTIIENRIVWMANGVNFQIGGDIQRRCYFARLDSKVPQPWLATGFKIPKLADYVTTHRGELLAHLFTVCRYWIKAGKPGYEGHTIGTFEEWASVIGGMLQAVGHTDFLGNLNELYDKTDKDTSQALNFMEACYEQFSNNETTTGEIVARLKEKTEFMACLPDKVNPKAEEMTRSLGRWLSSKVKTRFANNRTVIDAGTKHHAKCWIFTPYKNGELETITPLDSPVNSPLESGVQGELGS